MKKIASFLPVILVTALLHAQTQVIKTVVPNKISLTIGQKITVQSSISIESSLAPGMDVTNNSTSENILEVKSSTDKNYTIGSTLTKIKVNMDMMGQATTYDSEKKEDQESEMGKAFAEKLNKPTDVILDINTGKASVEKKIEEKKNPVDGDPMQGLLKIMGDNGGDDAVVTGAFEIVPQGKNTGDNWSDSTVEKNMKVVRTYTLKSVTGKEAVIQLNMVMDAASTLSTQGMEVEFNSTTKTTGEIITDIETGLVKKKTTQAVISGSFQLMGQAVPINAKANSTITYK